MTHLSVFRKSFLIACSLLLLLMACNKRSGKPRVLVFSKTAGWHHESIPAGIAAIQKLGAENGFDVDTTTNSNWFVEDSLKKYAAVIFLNTTGDVLNHRQEAEFERYIQAGGGFVGVHSATDTEYDWGWYNKLVGGYFWDHPGINDSFPNVQPGVYHVVNADHAATKHLPKEWKRTDEFYSFKKLNKEVQVLLNIDEQSYKGGHKMGEHPMAWYHDYDGGRAFYTALGHTNESYTEEAYLKHLLGGIQYAIGDNRELDYSKAKTQKVPDEDRFVKTMLTQGTLFEPTEMAILPDLNVLIAQRRGELMLYDDKAKTVKEVGRLNVYWKTSTPGVNAEEGLMGLALDPDYKNNNFIYLFYSPVDTSVNRLSRFVFKDGRLDTTSEKVVLQFYSQREICCHTGGSIAFGKDNLLYLSTGDNSTPFDEPKQPYVNRGYAPLDDRPGHEQYDARRTSGNTNDLRGKIIRIRIKPDGSYEIPDGNLFPKNEPKARPEIYVMGNRNPYRISVDKRTGFLYWGEVGPDAGADSLQTRGPRGYDEVNQAKKAGYFGWPLFVGNNYAYREYDYATGKSGQVFDPAKPINTSRNNTGLQQLPAAQPAFIWYPYGPSPDFPQVGTGGRNAMAGPVYYVEDYPKETRLPDYYNKKLFIYDWIRGWVRVVTMDENGDFYKMEPFMESTRFNAPIDMEAGPDGRIYVLEYGSGWFSKNPDAGLARIDYIAGNRAPKVAGISVDKTSGTLPLKVVATVDAVDPEKEEMTYVWDLGNGVKKTTTEPRLEHTFDKAGEYNISVVITDKEKATAESGTVTVYAGNQAPEVHISVSGNQTFYFPGKPVAYSVQYKDPDDTAKTADPAGLFVSADYIEGFDKAGANLGHQVMTEAMAGRSLVQSLDCKTCHKEAEKSIGPSYTDVAKRYKDKAGSSEYLVQKIIKGGSGAWGEVAMPAHPNLKETDARQIVAWIKSLGAGAQDKKSLPANGTVSPTLNKPAKENGVLVLTASYTDKGANGVRPLTGHNSVALRNNRMNFNSVTQIQGFATFDMNGSKLMVVPKGAGWFRLDSLDLTAISGAELMVGWQQAPQFGYTMELRLDAPDGKKIGEAVIPANSGGKTAAGKMGGTLIKTAIEPVTDGRLHNLYVVSRPNNPQEPNQAALQWIQFNAGAPPVVRR